MARKTILICDSCGAEIKKSANILEIKSNKSRKVVKRADLCNTCVKKLPTEKW